MPIKTSGHNRLTAKSAFLALFGKIYGVNNLLKTRKAANQNQPLTQKCEVRIPC
jgi:hypothetical protein